MSTKSSTANGEFEPLERRRATADAIEAIQAQIRQGGFAPGHRLPSERALSEALGVSRPTVREAIQSLAAMRILEVRHGSGIYVGTLDMEELLAPVRFALELQRPTIRDLFEVRLVLEPLAARLAAERASEGVIAEMRELVALSQRARVTRAAILDYDTRLHEKVVEATGNPLLITIMRSLSVLSHHSREVTTRLRGATERARDDHERIVETIASHDSEAAQRAMLEHITYIRATLEDASASR